MFQPPALPPSSRTLSAADLEVLNQQILLAARSGSPLVPALASLSRDLKRGALKASVDGLVADLSAGRPLSEAIDRQPGRFPRLYAAMLRASEAGGSLVGVMEVLSNLVTSVASLRRRIVTASIYPLMILLVALGIVTLMTTIIAPKLTEAVDSMGGIVRSFGTSARMSGFSWLVWTTIAIEAVLVAAAFLCVAATLVPWGRMIWIEHVPFFGPVVRAQRAFILSRTLAVLLRSGVPLREAMGVVREVAPDGGTKRVLDGVLAELNAGRPFGAAMSAAAEQGRIPATLAWMSVLAESRGDLPDGLYEASEFFRIEAERRANFISQILPPVLVIGVGVLFICCILPIIMALVQVMGFLFRYDAY